MSDFGQVPVQNSTGSEQFGMLTRSVMKRRDIPATAKVVLTGMAMESGGTGRIAISHGALGLICGCSRTTALAACNALEAARLIEKDGPPIGQVQPYRILCARLVTKAAAPANVRRATRPKTIPVIHCPRCHNRCRGLLKVGWCRGCNWNDKVDRRIDAKLVRAKTA